MAQSSEAASQRSTSSAAITTPAGRVDCIRQRLVSQGFSIGSADVICQSWSVGTAKQYEAAWNAWTSWCSSKPIDLFQAPVATFLEFLHHIYVSGRCYSTVNSYRSAVSVTIEAVTGYSLGAHRLVSRFMKGVFMARPPQPKYCVTWDVRVVTNYLKTLSPYSSLTLKNLTLKLTALIALVTAQRCQSLCRLRLDSLTVTSDAAVFTIRDRLKNSSPGKTHLDVTIPHFVQDLELCPRNHLLCYLAKTEPLRKLGGQVVEQLFISYCKPHKAVSSATIARWLKAVLNQANIDTSIFTAHSYRSAATSAAHFKGASVADIMKLADWSSPSVFNKFYKKPIVVSDGPVGALILSK